MAGRQIVEFSPFRALLLNQPESRTKQRRLGKSPGDEVAAQSSFNFIKNKTQTAVIIGSLRIFINWPFRMLFNLHF